MNDKKTFQFTSVLKGYKLFGSVVNNLSPNFAGLYMQGATGSNSQTSMTQGSSSNEDVFLPVEVFLHRYQMEVQLLEVHINRDLHHPI